MIPRSKLSVLAGLLGFAIQAITFASAAYDVSVSNIYLTDTETEVEDIVAIHNSKPFNVTAELEWAEEIYDEASSNLLVWQLFIDGTQQAEGTVDLNDSRALPTSLNAGISTVEKSGEHVVEVKVQLDEVTAENDRAYRSFNAGASFVPLIFVLVLASTTQMVELSLGMGVFVGCCMITGTITAGFRTMLDTYILEALANVDHGFVYLFILFMAGLVGIIEKSGGLIGITHALKDYVKSSKSAQSVSFFAGLVIFFDDYANTLVAGASMRPLTDACMVSREKLAFVVDATAAPIASIVPISSWVGFEISLIQAELDKILASDSDPDIKTTGFTVFLETIKYRYYCIYMLMLMPLLIASGRDFGPMLIAERRTKVYGRTDGGPGAALNAEGEVLKSNNTPSEDTPCKWWNMVFPIVMLVVYIFYLLAYTGDDGSGSQSFVDKMQNADAYSALLWGTMAAALTAVGFYLIQDKHMDRIIFFNVKGYISRAKRGFASLKNKFRRTPDQDENTEGEEEVHARVLMSYSEAMTSFLLGMEKIFGAIVVLTLAWASGAIMSAVGLDRFFGEILKSDALDYRMLPTLSFIIAMIIAFATGTSWGTMTIMFPLVLVPSYEASGGNANIFYGVTAGILAGAVAGDHASPISDTTILASMASECTLLNHVKTQAPYALLVALWSVLVGTIPSGRGAYSSGIAALMGFVAMLFHVVFTAEFAINKTGRYDIFTEIYLRFAREKDELLQLKEDVKIAYETGEPVEMALKKSITHEDTKDVSMSKTVVIDRIGVTETNRSATAHECVPINEDEDGVDLESSVKDEQAPLDDDNKIQ
mmetsp:Transcript_7379/g.13926  ORF Transcript_7379/g.13926 Transcript_7379/m.13926 type:complete len:823 (+) Transcript_7379:121-2589(+)|eukprot:CAMPEP_0171328148 /NCGR_PEP_ID=MMETSP0878-20121228/475_1 /TAXON_ID=67004 /ORGANISM="Thalassiosira weissflogii, Strain CCMP1336" /LENGTH=822 /DNA_ID=CAMNT_0011827977 /DNA_START=98 /DNA_END=2566 /DNA_ORIENTATION=-